MKYFSILILLLVSTMSFSQKGVVATGTEHQYVAVNNVTHRFTAVNVSAEMRQKLTDCVKNKKQIVTTVAFTPTGGWTILTTKGYWARNIGGDYFNEVKKVYKKGNHIISVAFNPAHWKRLKGFAFVSSTGESISKHVGGSRTDRDRWLLAVYNKNIQK